MTWKKSLKYPVLIIGIVWFAIYLSDPKTSDFWTKAKYRFYPDLYVCDNFKDRVLNNIDSNWTLHCPSTTHLIIRIDQDDEKLLKIQDELEYKKVMYNLLFNSVVQLINVSDSDNLESFKKVQINMKTDKLGVILNTDGLALGKIRRELYLIKASRLHHRATVELKERGFKPQFDKKLNGQNSAPTNIDAEVWEEVLESEKEKMVKINFQRFIEKLKDPTSGAKTLLGKVNQYDPKTQDRP